MSILIGADFIATPSNECFFLDCDLHSLLGDELVDLLKSADYRIFNLESPLTNQAAPIIKSGPNLINKTDVINTYKKLDVNLFTIGNNHILDQGEQGLFSTMSVLDQAGIPFIGAGKNVDEAAKPYFFRFQNKTIGVFACAEHEFSIADETHCGANPVDLLETPDIIARIKEKCDYLIILYHGGKECYRYPVPYLRKICHKFVDKGADLILIQHTHCVGCKEEYKGATIVYGQGNFLFDSKSDEFWNYGLLLRIEDDFSLSFFPVEKIDHCARLCKDEKILAGFFKRSEEIKDEGLIEKKFSEYAKSMCPAYLFRFSNGEGFWQKVLRNLFGEKIRYKKIKKDYTTGRKAAILDIVRCEAHREVVIEGLKEDIKK